MTDSTFAGHLRDALTQGDFLGLVLSRAVGADPPPRQDVRLVIGKGGPTLQWAQRIGRQEHHRNLSIEDSVAELERLYPAFYRDGNLFTGRRDVQAMASRKGTIRITTKPPTRSDAAPATHDRKPQRLLPDDTPTPFLHAIGVMDATGHVHSKKQDKFRQINRYLELVDDVLPALPAEGRLRVVDFGCGKSALTFGLHHLLTRLRGREVDLLGLDVNPAVVATCQGVTDGLGLTDLRFAVGDIASHTPDGPVHLAVALHACDTATDDALQRAVEWGADVILSVPCCQHELSRIWAQDGLAPLAEHGILRERFAALATDGLRAAALEARGYRTQVVEFIDMEHTPKNVLIRAVRGPDDPARRARFLAQYAATKRHLGLGGIRLDALVGGAGPP